MKKSKFNSLISFFQSLKQSKHSKINILIIIFILTTIFLSACNRNNLWKNDSDNTGNNNRVIVLPDVTMTSVKSGSGDIILVWTDPAGAVFDAVNIVCTDTSTSAEFSNDQVLPGVQTHTITGVIDGTEYSITLTVTDLLGNSSTGVSFNITPAAAVTDGHFIYTADDLNGVRGGVTGYDTWTLSDDYFLMADIDIAGYSAGDGNGWMPIGDNIDPFAGCFEGNNYTINNLTISRGGMQYIGLFGYITGDVKDLNIANAAIQGGDFVGALAGSSNGGNIENCSATGTVLGNTNVGGLIGENNSILLNCYAQCNVSSTGDFTGGLVGNSSGDITGCYAQGTVTVITAQADFIGGLAGSSGGIITDSYTTDTCDITVTLSAATNFINVGGLTGVTAADIINSYTQGDIDVNITSDPSGAFDVHAGGLVGLANASITIDGSYAIGATVSAKMTGSTGGIDGLHTGGLIGDNSATIINCYATCAVSTTADVNVDNQDTGGLVGRNNGDVSYSYKTGDVTGAINVGGLIGLNNGGVISYCYQTTGTITGAGDNVGGLIGNNTGPLTSCYATGFVSGSGAFYGGLIGVNAGADIDSCYATGDVTNNGSYNTAGLIGMNGGSLIQNCWASGIITGNSNATAGLIANNNTSTISNCYASGEVISNSGMHTAGLVAYNYGGSTIQNSRAVGPLVTGNGENVGGLVGLNTGSSVIMESYAICDVLSYAPDTGGLVGDNTSGIIQRSFATGNVTGTTDVGGLVGNSSANIENSYAKGDVSGTDILGGLVGYIDACSVSYCYSTGVVTSATAWGGLIGLNNLSSATITICYYNLENNSGGSNLDGFEVTPLTDMTLESTYTGWDISPAGSTIWNIQAGINQDYPYLRTNPPQP